MDLDNFKRRKQWLIIRIDGSEEMRDVRLEAK